jgi:methyl-accepting chemotaxis protein
METGVGLKLRTKIFLASGLPPLLIVPLVFTGALLGNLAQARGDAVQKILRTSLARAALEIDKANGQAFELARLMAVAQQGGLFGERKRSLELMRHVLEASPGITASYIAYEPNADGNDGRAPAAGIDPKSLAQGGRFVPYMSRSADKTPGIELLALADLDKRYVYQGLVNLMKGAPESQGIQLPGGISSLYRDQPAAPGAEIRMVTEPAFIKGRFVIGQSVPIVINGAFAGIAAVDRSLDDIDARLQALKPFETAEFILVSKRGRVISSTTSVEHRLRRLEDTPYAAPLSQLFQTGEIKDMGTFTDPRTGDARVYVGMSIPNGEWRLLLSASKSEIFGLLYSRLATVMGLLVLSGVLAMGLAFFFLRRIIGRVERAAGAAAQVASGDLTVQVQSSVSDESGRMLRAIGDMVRSLEGLVNKVKSSSAQVVTLATDISASASRQKQTSREFDASTSQISATTQEITATSRQLLQTVDEVSQATRATAQVAQTGRAELDRMEETMRQMSGATQSIAGKLSVIAERAHNIGAVVTTITKVADQTNLLSLNAAIEAEKAGEYGQGFSVVAREIRRLADQTAVSTLDIERLVSEMQASVASGVTEMARYDEQVRQGVQEVMQVGAQLSTIIQGVGELGPRFETAQQSMKAQVAGADQINGAMMQLSEIAKAGRQSSESLHEVSAQLLSALDSLRDEVARFRTAAD